MKKSILIYLSIYLSISLNGQVIHNNEKEKGTSIQRNASFNVEELKVRWKKAALENCTGIPCVVTPPAPSFTCGSSTVSDYDGNVYETVAIVGTGVAQCWTKTNLKVTKYNEGTPIPDLTLTGWPSTSGARTGYVATGVTGVYVGTFGYLYNWYAVNDSRKLCPTGWHVPTDPEWTIMIQALVPSEVLSALTVQSSMAGTVMKSTVTGSLGWASGSPGTNTSGFTALPGGVRIPDGRSLIISNNAFFWSATEYNFGGSDGAWDRELDYNTGNVARVAGSGGKLSGLSVRCLRD
jgi:uncharacterized protein (TIGR02145 family)